MWIDLGVALLIVITGILGLFEGIIVQLFRLGGLVAVFFYAKYVSEPLGQWFSAAFKTSAGVGFWVVVILGSMLIYLVASLIGKYVTKKVTDGGGAPEKVNRTLGGLAGAVKGAAFAFVILAVLDMVNGPSMAGRPAFKAQLDGSVTVGWVSRVNPLAEFRFLADIESYQTILVNPNAQASLSKKKCAQALLANATFRAAAADPEVRRLINGEHWQELLVNGKVKALYLDPEVRRILNDRAFREAVREAAKLPFPEDEPAK
jgi:uncharacterized membrane protein required for colicin V production